MGGGAAGWAIAAQGVTDIGKTVAAGVASKIAWKRTKRILKNRHQWEVADLIAAGLNPILSATKGPGGGAFSPIQSIPGGPGIGATALSGMKLRSEINVLRQQAETLGATAAQARSQSVLNAWKSRKVELEVEEFKPSVGGVARRFFGSDFAKDAAKKFLNAVGDVPDWIRERVLRNAAERK